MGNQIIYNGNVYSDTDIINTPGVGEFTTNEGAKSQQGINSERFNDYSFNVDSQTGDIIYANKATGDYSHAEGQYTTAGGTCTHAEGYNTTASGNYSHTEGYVTTTGIYNSEQETFSGGYYAHAEGRQTNAQGTCSHAEGNGTTAGKYAHSEGNLTVASGEASHSEGNSAVASGEASHAEGYSTTASGQYAHTEGMSTKAIGMRAHAEGTDTKAGGAHSHAEGRDTSTGNFDSQTGEYVDGGMDAHAEGLGTKAIGQGSHAEGNETTAAAQYSHVEGEKTVAASLEGYSVKAAHAEGIESKAFALGAHAEGYNTVALGNYAHTEGANTQASGFCSHAGGNNTKASGDNQTVIGKFNKEPETPGDYAFIIGNGNEYHRSNVLTLTWDGWLDVAGGYKVNGQPISTGGGDTANPNISDAYDSTATYSVGEYCIYNDTLYKCTTAVSAAEAFDSSKWTATTVSAELLDIISRISALETALNGYSFSDTMTQAEYDEITPEENTFYPVTES